MEKITHENINRLTKEAQEARSQDKIKQEPYMEVKLTDTGIMASIYNGKSGNWTGD